MENAPHNGGALDENLVLSLDGENQESSEREPVAQARGYDWSWSRDADDIVIPEQPQTACHLNPQGQIVVRQDGWPDHDGDHIIIIAPSNVGKLIDALMRLVEADQ